jgi:hypothetical protein
MLDYHGLARNSGQMLRRRFLAGVALVPATPAWAWRKGCGAVDFVVRFGAVGNGSKDNSAALLAFGIYGRAGSGSSVLALSVPAGTYKFNSSAAFKAFEGYSFVITGTGSPTFQNSLSKSGPWIPDCFSNLHQDFGGTADLIQTTAIGDTTVTLLRAAHASLYRVGSWVAVMSEDVQISASNFSYPPNANLFDYAEVVAHNATTGVVTLTPALTNLHKSTNIDGPSSNTNRCGKARIWLLDTSPAKFNVSHTFIGLTVTLGPSPITTYLGMSGRTVTWQNSTIPGISPQIAESAKVIGCTLTVENEPDKLVKNLLIKDTTSNVSMVFQSSSIDNLTIDNCTINVFLGTGTTKNVLIKNSTIALYGEGIAGSAFGHNLSTHIQNSSLVWAHFHLPWVVGGTHKRTIDGVNVTYASNVITVPKSTSDLADWNVVPGVTHANLCTGAFDYFTGDLGTVLVTSLTEDATNIYYHLSPGWGAALPGFANGKVYLSRHGSLTGSGLSGCKEALQLNAATAAGTYPWNLYTNTVLESDGSNINWNVVGDLKSLTVTVTNPTAASGAVMVISTNVVDATTMANSFPLVIKIDLTIAGTRTFTQSALTGKTGNDTVLLNSIAQTKLPADKWAQTQPTIQHSNFVPGAGSLIVAISATIDPGIAFRRAGA